MFLQNGVCHNSQPCVSDEKAAIDTDTDKKIADEEMLTANGGLSPSSLRRSTRICALKAAEKIKLKESMGPLLDFVGNVSFKLKSWRTFETVWANFPRCFHFFESSAHRRRSCGSHILILQVLKSVEFPGNEFGRWSGGNAA